MMIDQKDWIWHGFAGHYCCGSSCHFRLCTEIGKIVVSTVGALPNKIKIGDHPYQEIGLDRKFETMVFKVIDHCKDDGCNCNQPEIDPYDIDFLSYNNALEAREGHMKLCMKWASMDGLPQEIGLNNRERT